MARKRKRKKLKKVLPKKKAKRAKKTKLRKSVKVKPSSKTQPVKTVERPAYKTRIKIIGIGGGGSSVVSDVAQEIKKAKFIVANTDLQALREATKKAKHFRFGQKFTGGLGAGMDSKLGEMAAQDSREKIKKLLKETDLCVLISCLGGGTGSGTSPVFAEVSQEMGIVTFGIFTLPFEFEGRKKMDIARSSLEKLKPNLNAAVIISNERIFQLIDKETPLEKAFSAVNKFLAEGLDGLIEMIYSTGLINIDFADLKAILSGNGKLAYLNTVEAVSNRLEEATKKLLSNVLYPYSPQEAASVLFNVNGGLKLSMNEINQLGKIISESINPRGRIAFGITQENRDEAVKITLLANGCKWEKWEKEQGQTKKKLKKEEIKEQELISENKGEPESSELEIKERKPKRKPRKRRYPKIKIESKIPNKTEKQETVLPAEEPPQPATGRETLDEKRWEIPAFLRRK